MSYWLSSIRKRCVVLFDRIFPPPTTLWQHLQQNLIIGMLVVLLITIFQNTEFVHKHRELSLDWLMKMYSGTATIEDRAAFPFVFYDIDEKTHEAWGEPLFVPRQKLASLITVALQQQPSVLVIDVELLHASSEDTELQKVLNTHATLEGPTTLIFVRGFKKASDTDKPYLTARDSFLDKILPQTSRQVWASPLFELDPDGQIRRWKFWQSACSSAGKPTTVPSVQLAALAILSGPAARQALDNMVAEITPSNCHLAPRTSNHPLPLGSQIFSIATDVFGQRVFFSLPWQLAKDETRPEIRFNGQNIRLLNIVPARAVTEGGMRPEFPLGHVAVIGASHQDARDTHATPLGSMPGSLILINAIHSLVQHGQIHSPPLWVQLPTAALLLIAVSFVFIKFPSLKGAIISLLGTLIVLAPASLYLFRYGIWLDFALPLIAIKLFQIAMQYHRQHMDRKGLQT